MNSVPLRLIPSTAARSTAAAWLISGSEPERWLREISRCGIGTDDARLFVIPKSAVDVSPAGLFVVAPAGAKHGLQPSGALYASRGGESFFRSTRRFFQRSPMRSSTRSIVTNGWCFIPVSVRLVSRRRIVFRSRIWWRLCGAPLTIGKWRYPDCPCRRGCARYRFALPFRWMSSLKKPRPISVQIRCLSRIHRRKTIQRILPRKHWVELSEARCTVSARGCRKFPIADTPGRWLMILKTGSTASSKSTRRISRIFASDR